MTQFNLAIKKRNSGNRRAVHLLSASLGGVARVYEALAEGALNQGWEFVRVEPPKRPSSTSLGASSRGELGRFTAEVVNEIRRYDPDLVVIHLFGDPWLLNSVRYLPRSTKLLIYVHCRSLATIRAVRCLVEYAVMVIAVSRGVLESVASVCGDIRTEIVQNPVSPSSGERFVDPVGTSRRSFLYAGRLDDSIKGVFSLPALLTKLRSRGLDLTLTIAGEGEDRDALLERLERCNLLSVTRYVGWVDPQELRTLMGAHDLCLFPSYSEGFSLSYLEAVANGCIPIFRQDCSGLMEQSVELDCGIALRKWGQGPELERLMKQILDNAYLESMRERGLLAARPFFVDNVAARVARLFDESLGLQQKSPYLTLHLDDVSVHRDLRARWWTILPPRLISLGRRMRGL